MINIFARCLIRFPVVTVWSGQGRMGGLEGRSSCEPLLLFSVEISSGSSELSRHNTCTGDLLGRRMQNSGQCGQHAMQSYLPPVTGPGLLDP